MERKVAGALICLLVTLTAILVGLRVRAVRLTAPGAAHAAADGRQKYYDSEGRLTAEIQFENGQWLWRRTYYPSGAIQTVSYEDWLFRTVVEHYAEDGRLVLREVR